MGYLVCAYECFVGLVDADIYLWSLNIFLQIKNKKVRIYKTRALEFYICVLMRRNYVFYTRMWYRPVHYINTPETNCIYVVVLLLILGSSLFDKWDFRDFQIHI